MIFSGYFERAVRTALRSLPAPDYYKTRLWATSIGSPQGRVHDWAYYRCIELATRAFATAEGYQIAFPGAGEPGSRYSMLEFGVARGQSLQIMLHFRDVWLRRLGLKNRVMVAGFDTFEGIPAPRAGDEGLDWREGDFNQANKEEIERTVGRKFQNLNLVKGKFADTLPGQGDFLREYLPVFVSIDCDYYSSTMDIFNYLLPERAPHGCLFYFDDVSMHFYTDLTGELKAVKEVNEGAFGDHIRLVEHPLWIETGELRHYRQVWRLFNLKTAEQLAGARRPGFRQVTRRPRLAPL